VQENVFERHPDAELRVYVVWVPRIPTDERFQVAELITDDRATLYWDNERRIEQHFAERGGYGGAAYDFFYVYGPDARWGDEPEATGTPVVIEASKLQEALRPYLD
jgi:hypothetical protein